MNSFRIGRKNPKERSAIFIGRILLYFVFFSFSVMILYPLIWMVLGSFHSTCAKDSLAWPSPWTLENYAALWQEGNFSFFILNSTIYVILTVILTLFFSTMAGFALAKLKNRVGPFIFISFVIGLFLNVQSFMVTLTMSFRSVGLDNLRIGVLLSYIGQTLPIGVYLLTKYIRSIPDSLIESARIEGASFLYIFWKIIFPMTKPINITYAILIVSNLWNEFMLANVLASDFSAQSLCVGIFHFFHSTSDCNKQLAALVLSAFPLLLYFLIFHQQITRGVCIASSRE